jgi:hypothetical protein
MAATRLVSRKLSVVEALDEAGLACLSGWFSLGLLKEFRETGEPIDLVIMACALVFGLLVLIHSHAMARVFRRVAQSEGAFAWVDLVMRAFSVALPDCGQRRGFRLCTQGTV